MSSKVRRNHDQKNWSGLLFELWPDVFLALTPHARRWRSWLRRTRVVTTKHAVTSEEQRLMTTYFDRICTRWDAVIVIAMCAYAQGRAACCAILGTNSICEHRLAGPHGYWSINGLELDHLIKTICLEYPYAEFIFRVVIVSKVVQL
jgi:hypothetical protein